MKNDDGDDDVGRKKREEDRETQKEREGGKKQIKEGKGEQERDGERHRTLMLSHKGLSRSKSVACAEVQAGVLKALAGSSTHKKTCPTVKLFGPCSKTGRTRPEKNACM